MVDYENTDPRRPIRAVPLKITSTLDPLPSMIWVRFSALKSAIPFDRLLAVSGTATHPLKFDSIHPCERISALAIVSTELEAERGVLHGKGK
jgi:hypothetical protein